MTKIENRSVRRTKNKLKEGMITLMRDKSLNEITVRELTELVDLNRGTFYLHYRDVFDMVEKIETEMAKEIEQILETYSDEITNHDPQPILEAIFTFLADNYELCQVLISKHGDIAFVEQLKELIKTQCIHKWEKIKNLTNPDLSELYYSYIISGCLGIIEYWLKNNTSQTPKELAQITKGIILNQREQFLP